MATITFFHAHPDDEAIATGGTMAALADEGHRVVLVTATRGELGEIPDGLLDPGESLADRRMVELTEACRVLGVGRQTFLDYLDSGMAGEATNDAAGQLRRRRCRRGRRGAWPRILTEEAADVLVTYDEHGGYGHPDHVQVHRVGMRAADAGRDPGGLHGHHEPRLHAELWPSGSSRRSGSLPKAAPTGWTPWASRPSRLTTEVDVAPWIERKRQAMTAHASQISETSFFLAMPQDVFSTVWGREWYIRVRPAVGPAGRDSRGRPAVLEGRRGDGRCHGTGGAARR